VERLKQPLHVDARHVRLPPQRNHPVPLESQPLRHALAGSRPTVLPLKPLRQPKPSLGPITCSPVRRFWLTERFERKHSWAFHVVNANWGSSVMAALTDSKAWCSETSLEGVGWIWWWRKRKNTRSFMFFSFLIPFYCCCIRIYRRNK
jgi:hypothetical protein